MPRLIKGSELNAGQRAQVLNAYVHRWTHTCPAGKRVQEETARQLEAAGKEAKPLQTDEEWLADHAFYFTNDGSRLAANRSHCEPAYMADSEQ